MQAIAYVARIFIVDIFTDPTISRQFSLEETWKLVKLYDQ